ncbi:MAG: hypothetical protein QOH48_12 [Actinomycetota bacterium]|jgi:hypothetical protein|nr:hypothetical protein [Actinomycetota bacterium]
MRAHREPAQFRSLSIRLKETEPGAEEIGSDTNDKGKSAATQRRKVRGPSPG